MAREIKFRATLKGKVVAYIRISPDEDGNLHTLWSPDNVGGWILSEPPKHDNLDIDTGLKDKNGKEIYEWDIIQRWNGGYGPIEYRGDKFVVVFDDPRHPGYCEGLLSYIYPREGEVIGNIYQNPELLK
jgi:hypothetical protein